MAHFNIILPYTLTIPVELSRHVSDTRCNIVCMAEIVEFISWYYPFKKHWPASIIPPTLKFGYVCENSNINVYIYMYI
jgi:hypothetical protein